MGRVAIAMLVVVTTPVALFALFRLLKTIGKAPRSGVNLSRAGLMELQSLLEPERKIEIVREMERKEDLLVTLDDHLGA